MIFRVNVRSKKLYSNDKWTKYILLLKEELPLMNNQERVKYPKISKRTVRQTIECRRNQIQVIVILRKIQKLEYKKEIQKKQ